MDTSVTSVKFIAEVVCVGSWTALTMLGAFVFRFVCGK